jgi:uncharacterized membrane protein YgcG
MDEEPFGCLLLGLCGLLLWLSWPVSLWFIGALICAALLHSQVEAQAHSSSSWLRLWQTALPALRDSAVGIAVGLGIVTLAQAVFNAADTSSATVRRWEEIVTVLQHKLAATLSPSVVLTILVALLVISFNWPQYHLVNRFSSAKKWGSRVLVVLTTVTAFTFFSALAVSRSEPHWVAKREPEAREAVQTIEEGRRELLSLAWLEAKSQVFPPPLKKELADFFVTARETNDPEAAHGLGAEWFARQAPIIPAPAASEPPDSFDKVNNWLARKGPAPLLEDVAVVSAESRKVTEMLPPARIVAEEALKAALASFIPANVDPLLKPFIKALTGALVKNALANYPIRRITDYKAAVALIREKRNSNDGKPMRTMLQMWRWSFPRVRREAIPRETDPGGPGYITGPELANHYGNPSAGSSGSSSSGSSFTGIQGNQSYGLGSSSFSSPGTIYHGPITPYRGPVAPVRGVAIR